MFLMDRVVCLALVSSSTSVGWVCVVPTLFPLPFPLLLTCSETLDCVSGPSLYMWALNNPQKITLEMSAENVMGGKESGDATFL